MRTTSAGLPRSGIAPWEVPSIDLRCLRCDTSHGTMLVIPRLISELANRPMPLATRRSLPSAANTRANTNAGIGPHLPGEVVVGRPRPRVVLHAASAGLTAAQCSLGRVARRRVRHARRGRVIAQSPPGGSHRRRGEGQASTRELNGAIRCGPRRRRLGTRADAPCFATRAWSRWACASASVGWPGRLGRLLLSADPESIHVADVRRAGPALR